MKNNRDAFLPFALAFCKNNNVLAPKSMEKIAMNFWSKRTWDTLNTQMSSGESTYDVGLKYAAEGIENATMLRRRIPKRAMPRRMSREGMRLDTIILFEYVKAVKYAFSNCESQEQSVQRNNHSY